MKSERDALIEKINLLQIQQTNELAVLKEQFQITYDSFKPLNLIKSTFQDITSTSKSQGDLVDGALNLATGLISKNILFTAVEKPVKKLLSNGIQFILRKLKPKKE